MNLEHHGILVTFEGPEGSGKSTLLVALHTYLLDAGLRVCATKEPGGSPLGTAIRSLLLDSPADVPARAELLLFAADRAAHVETVLRPALADGIVVLCDRYSESTFAYQGAGRSIPSETLAQLDQYATGGLRADLVVLLDVPVEVSRSRVQARREPDRLEREPDTFHQRVREAFLALADREPGRFLVLDAREPVEVLLAALLARLVPLLPDPPHGDAPSC